MRKFKKLAAVVCTLAIGTATCVGVTACGTYEDPGVYKGVDVANSTLWVGNTAGTTGALADIGVPFNIGLEAALKVYNDKGGFSGTYNGEEVSGLKVKLKHYDDNADEAKTVAMMSQLCNEDEVFAIVGNFGAASVSANLGIIKEAHVPMVYAAAGVDELFNEKAEDEDRYIMPVQPLNATEGEMMILRAFGAVENGGLGATKVGVISNTNTASESILSGIKKGAESLTAEQKANISYQKVTGTNFANAVSALKDANCDVIVSALIASDFTAALTAMSDAQYYKVGEKTVQILASYNNASTGIFETDQGGESKYDSKYDDILTNTYIYTQSWVDITSEKCLYVSGSIDDTTKAVYEALGYELYLSQVPTLYTTYMAINAALGYDIDFFPGFNAEYWAVAEAIYNYCLSVPDYAASAYAMSYNAYALAGYIAGDLFCQGLDELNAQELTLTRSNYVDVMESKDYKLVMANDVSFKDGVRRGVETFGLNVFALNNSAVSTKSVDGLKTIAELKETLNG